MIKMSFSEGPELLPKDTTPNWQNEVKELKG
jgi:hypothetical protein